MDAIKAADTRTLVQALDRLTRMARRRDAYKASDQFPTGPIQTFLVREHMTTEIRRRHLRGLGVN